jgi:hypothetical protein
MALQSRPERSAPWTYRFYVDVEGSAQDPRVAEALEEIEALAAELIILGSYEAWTEGSRLSAPVPTPAHRVEKPAVPLVDRRRNPEGTVVAVRDVRFGEGSPVLIAGPCSVESEAMILETAQAVAQAGGDMLRGRSVQAEDRHPTTSRGSALKGCAIWRTHGSAPVCRLSPSAELGGGAGGGPLRRHAPDRRP